MISIIQNMFLGNLGINNISTHRFDISETTFNTIIETTAAFLEYVLGIIMGSVAGWAVGWSSGSLYQDLFEPTYLTTFEAVRFWYYLPHTFGQYGAITAAYISIPIVYVASIRRFNQHVIESQDRQIQSDHEIPNRNNLSGEKE